MDPTADDVYGARSHRGLWARWMSYQWSPPRHIITTDPLGNTWPASRQHTPAHVSRRQHEEIKMARQCITPMPDISSCLLRQRQGYPPDKTTHQRAGLMSTALQYTNARYIKLSTTSQTRISIWQDHTPAGQGWYPRCSHHRTDTWTGRRRVEL